MAKRYFPHAFSEQSPHTTDSILFYDVTKGHNGYRP